MNAIKEILGSIFSFKEEEIKENLGGEFAKRDKSIDNYMSILGILPDPDPILRKIDESGTVLKDLMADDHVTSVIQTRKVGTLNRAWKIEPGKHGMEDPDEQSMRAYEAFSRDMDNLNMYDVISQILEAPYYGMAPIEIIYKPEKGIWHIGELRCLPAHWFSFDRENEPRFKSAQDLSNGLRLPEHKFVFARNFPTYENPYGLRLLSRCFWPVTFKKGGVTFWMKFLEKFGIPHVIGHYKEGTSYEQKAKILSDLSNMVQDAIALVPEGTAVNALNAGNKEGGDGSFRTLKEAMEAGISKVIMGETLTTELPKQGGSYGAAKIHESILKEHQKCDARLVKDAMEQIAWIYCEVNFPRAANPRFVWHEEDNPKKEFAERDGLLYKTGVRFKKEYFMEYYGLKADHFEMKEEGTV